MKYALVAVELTVGVTLAVGMLAVGFRMFREDAHWISTYAISFVLFAVFFGTAVLASWLLGFPTLQMVRSM